MAAIRRNPAAVGQDRLDTVKDRLDTVKDRLEIVGEGPTRNRGRGTRSKSWERDPLEIVMAGRVPATRPQPAGPPRRLYNRQCVGGRDTPGHDGESA